MHEVVTLTLLERVVSLVLLAAELVPSLLCCCWRSCCVYIFMVVILITDCCVLYCVDCVIFVPMKQADLRATTTMVMASASRISCCCCFVSCGAASEHRGVKKCCFQRHLCPSILCETRTVVVVTPQNSTHIQHMYLLRRHRQMLFFFTIPVIRNYRT